jgi:hypothetical protein
VCGFLVVVWLRMLRFLRQGLPSPFGDCERVGTEAGMGGGGTLVGSLLAHSSACSLCRDVSTLG